MTSPQRLKMPIPSATRPTLWLGQDPFFPFPGATCVTDYGGVLMTNRQQRKRAAVRKAVREGKRPDRYPNGYNSWLRLSNEAQRQADEAETPGPSSPSRQHRQQLPRETSRRLPKVDGFDKLFSARPQNESERKAEEERNKRFKLGRPSPFGMNDPSPERPSAGSSPERQFDEIEDSFMFFEESSSGSSLAGASLSSWTTSLRRFSSSSPQITLGPLSLGSSPFPPRILLNYETLSIPESPFSHERVASSFTNAEGTDLPRRGSSSDAYADCRKRESSALDVPVARCRAAESAEESRSSEDSYTQAKRSQTSLWVSSLSASSFSTDTTDTTDATGKCTGKRKRELSEAQRTDINSWSDCDAGNGKKQVQGRPQSTHDKFSEPVGIGLTIDTAIDVPAASDGSHVGDHGTGPWSMDGAVANGFGDIGLADIPGRARKTSEVSAESSFADPSL
ncbi:MAG: hypothetical protein Q9182_005894 [Xanthomendoza sp. 2 TL-2023]